ncbi:hypothetical protein [Escherichia coli]|uniref:hypothetical protein n=1 Tax=Escherichia coli TaxID=562 RepID=UPI000A18378D|nr:hypothetical protein [Escherichia coli]OSK19167.1 hypothetical protein EALG_04542 [Escherichia coli TA144]
MQNAGAGIAEISPVPGAGADNSRSSFCWHPPVSQQFVILTDSSFLSYRQSQLFVSKRAFVDASSPA